MVLLPKVKIEVVVSKVPVTEVVKAAKEALYTGNIGDGKIFVYDVENVIKVRTGEEGVEALQGSCLPSAFVIRRVTQNLADGISAVLMKKIRTAGCRKRFRNHLYHDVCKRLA